uniref:Uncharacterized protein n=1 Tax=Neobodo designis TaxID=312471 RepID=A0A7S1R4A4_NEODS|mmetsp:Transcript_8187/g.25548  ORF Transcript_8187/g.25548 Transcript_8187/m.25548 type:complete len:389 (+) Transcript_8187:55-1221(+)
MNARPRADVRNAPPPPPGPRPATVSPVRTARVVCQAGRPVLPPPPPAGPPPPLRHPSATGVIPPITYHVPSLAATMPTNASDGYAGADQGANPDAAASQPLAQIGVPGGSDREPAAPVPTSEVPPEAAAAVDAALPLPDPYAALPAWVPRTNVPPPVRPPGSGPIRAAVWEARGEPPPPPPPSLPQTVRSANAVANPPDADAEWRGDEGDGFGNAGGAWDDEGHFCHDDVDNDDGSNNDDDVEYPAERRVAARGRLGDDDARVVMTYALTGRRGDADAEDDAAVTDAVERSRSTVATTVAAGWGHHTSRHAGTTRVTPAAGASAARPLRLTAESLEMSAAVEAEMQRAAARRRAAQRAMSSAARRAAANTEARNAHDGEGAGRGAKEL